MRRPGVSPTPRAQPPRRRTQGRQHLRNLGIMVVGFAVILGVAATHDALSTDATTSTGPPLLDAPADPEPPDAAPRPEEPSRPADVPTLPPGAPRHPVSGFIHPGVLVSRDQLDTVRARLANGASPYTEALARLKRSSYADLDWVPHPRDVVNCGYYSNPDRGCTHEQRDSLAAYTQALLWYLTLDPLHAQKAIEIINAWSRTVTAHTGPNAPLQAGWSAATMVRAAELVAHTYSGWSQETRERAAAMFRDIYLPLVRDGAPRGSEGNWDLIMIDAVIGIAVFLDDRPLFDYAIAQWRERLPAYIYLSSDGRHPVGPPGGVSDLTDYWHGETAYVNGQTQETCRDMQHTGWGLEAAVQIAETAWIQGVDIYAEAQPRLVAALELHSGLANGEPVPRYLCDGLLEKTFAPIPEIAYNHYRHRMGIEMPKTERLLTQNRPQRASHFFGWATLTTAGTR